MKEDLVLYHLAKSENPIQSLLSFPPRLKRRDEGAFSWRHDSRFPPNTLLTVDIKIPRTPLMESIFTYVWEHHLIHLRFQYHWKRSSGSWVRRHGVRIPLLWPMYHILPHSIQYRLLRSHSARQKEKNEGNTKSIFFDFFSFSETHHASCFCINFSIYFVLS